MGSCICRAQIPWHDSTVDFTSIEWNNYSTSYIGEGKDSVPLLVTAIPYNGIYSAPAELAGATALNMSFSGSLYNFRSNLGDRNQVLYACDSSAVYFIAPGVFASNAALYEYRVTENGSRVIKPWAAITQFTDSAFQLNTFRRRCAFLGGFSTGTGNYITVELRRRRDQSIQCAAAVYWVAVQPVLKDIYTAAELNDLLMHVKTNARFAAAAPRDKWTKLYKPAGLDSVTGLPKKLVLPSKEHDLYFFLTADIYKKEALEYRLLRNNKIAANWQPNAYDNGLIWLKDLDPGSYVLQMRYRMQRQHVTAYVFEITPAWYQTMWFKVAAVLLVISFLGSIALLVTLRRQRLALMEEQAKKEKQALGLRAIRAQLNPHFIFNALSSIQGLINKQDMDGANRYLSDFGMLVRHSLTESDTAYIPLQKEIATLDTYLRLEQLRFNFAWSIDCENAPDTSAVELPSLLLQPLVENAVKHGVSGMGEQGRIQVRFSRQGKDLLVLIQDNGAGFDTAVSGTGYGLKLTHDRIRLLNEMTEGTIITMQVQSAPAQGTIIRLLFKNWLA
ncbi:sensor histidine kinase [Deminuibacter soli]|uniref:sensor histidine kinase n=1 Tax=Deminuibacter soli TaxID=2291815 RepID=UPI001313DD9E|nr:histidine kinase [Deminuibacter soli]